MKSVYTVPPYSDAFAAVPPFASRILSLHLSTQSIATSVLSKDNLPLADVRIMAERNSFKKRNTEQRSNVHDDVMLLQDAQRSSSADNPRHKFLGCTNAVPLGLFADASDDDSIVTKSQTTDPHNNNQFSSTTSLPQQKIVLFL